MVPVAAPKLATIEVQSQQGDFGRRGPGNNYDAGVHGRRCRGVAAVTVLRESRRWIVVAPEGTAVGRIRTANRPLGRFRVATSHKNATPPNHGRGMAHAGQRDLPVIVFLRPLGRHRCGVADAGAVGTAETAPLAFLGIAPGRKQRNRGDDPRQKTTQRAPPSRPTGSWPMGVRLPWCVRREIRADNPFAGPHCKRAKTFGKQAVT